jgi:hypothetical protein
MPTASSNRAARKSMRITPTLSARSISPGIRSGLYWKRSDATPYGYLSKAGRYLFGSIQLVATLQLWVTGISIDFDKSRQIARKSVEALWKHCTFDIQR